MENLNKDIKTPFGENMNLSAADCRFERVVENCCR